MSTATVSTAPAPPAAPAAGPTPFAIDDSGCWIDLVINNVTVSVDLAELQDALWKIERNHKDDAWCCRACDAEFVPDKDDLRHYAETEIMVCPFCEQAKMPDDGGANYEPSPCCVPPQAFLDDVKLMLTTKYGVPRVSRHGAGEFYKFVAAKLNDLKKTSETSPESIFGSEPTPEAGPSPAVVLG